MRARDFQWRRLLAIVSIGMLWCLASEAKAVSVVTSRVTLSGDDALDWATLGGTGTVVVDNDSNGTFPSFNVTSNNGMLVNVQVSQTLRRPDNPVLVDTLGSYASLAVEDAFFSDGSPNAAVLTFRFDFPQLVSGFGADIFADSNFSNTFAFARLYDAAGIAIGGPITLANSTNGTISGFRGVVSDDRQPLFDKAEIIFSTGLHSALRFELQTEVNRLDVVTGATVVPTPSAVGVGLTAFTLLALVRHGRRRESTSHKHA